MMGPTNAFKETQWMIKNPWFAWVPALFFVMYTSGYGALLLRGAATDLDLVLWLLTGLALPAVLCTWRLTTEVVGGMGCVGGEIRVSLPPVWGLSWRVSTTKVVSAEPMQYERFKDYGAYGVRRVVGVGWVWNALGTDAVRMKIEGSADRIIGTQRPDELLAALGVVEAFGEAEGQADEKRAA